MNLTSNLTLEDNLLFFGHFNLTWSSFTSPTAITFYQWLPVGIFTLIFIVPFFGPLAIAVSFYSSSFMLWLFACKRVYKKGYGKVDNDSGKNVICKLFHWMSYLWHGYEVIGSEKLPSEGSLILFYQGSLPVDVLYFATTMWRKNNRTCFVLTHTKQFKVTGWKRFHRRLNFIPLTREDCVETLLEGHDVVATLGEDIETKGSEKYVINWNKRSTFATIAAAAKAPIVPAFTSNIGEAFWDPWFLPNDGKRYPVVVGGLPVKLTTYIGQPILFDGNISTKELATRACDQLQMLVNRHQRIPGNRFRALTDRLGTATTKDEVTIRPIPKPTDVEYSEFVCPVVSTPV